MSTCRRRHRTRLVGIGTNRETVTREINALTKAGVLQKQKRALLIQDVSWLQGAVAVKLGEFAPKSDD